MELIDFDGLFDEKLTVYMEEKKGKYTERQWEDLIPKLYKKFGDTFVAKIKCTPKEYYAKMTDEQLVETLSEHIREDIPVPEFLCAEIEERGAVETLAPCTLLILSATTKGRTILISNFSKTPTRTRI